MEVGDLVYLWTVYYKNQDWCCYVIASTRGRAKYLFQYYWENDLWVHGEFTDIRLNKVKEANGYREGVYDMDCDVLLLFADILKRMTSIKNPFLKTTLLQSKTQKRKDYLE